MKMLIPLVTWLCFYPMLSSSMAEQGTLPCQFPFIYNGVTYSSCTTTDDTKLWCSTKTDSQNKHIRVSEGGSWKYCSIDKHIRQQQQLCETKISDQKVTPLYDDSHPSTTTNSKNTRTTNITCGIRSNTIKIVGGENAKLGAWPWMAIIRARETNPFSGTVGVSNWICGGVLITEQFVLSAAHCFTNQLIEYVRIGEYDLNNVQDSPLEKYPSYHQDICVESVIKHKEYGRRSNDIALVKLDKPAKLDDNFVQPICLPHQPEYELFPQHNHESNIGFAAGWGITDIEKLFAVEGSDILQQVTLKIVDTDWCNTQKKKHGQSIMCAGEGDGKDTCRGDSGGPLMLSTNFGTWYVVGITSYGNTVCGSPGYQTVFTSVYYYRNWIAENIKAHA